MIDFNDIELNEEIMDSLEKVLQYLWEVDKTLDELDTSDPKQSHPINSHYERLSDFNEIWWTTLKFGSRDN